MPVIRTQIVSAKKKLNIGIWLDTFSRWLALWLQAVAVVIVLLKVFGLHRQVLPEYVLLSGIPIFIGVFFACMGRGFAEDDTVAWLDLKNRAGGRIIGGRLDKTDLSVLPSLTVMPFLKKILLPLLFLGIAMLVPGAKAEDVHSPAAIRRRVKSIQRKIEKAQVSGALSEQETRKLMEQAERLTLDARKNPEVAAEGADALNKMLEQKIIERAKENLQAMKAAEELSGQGSGKSSEKAKARENFMKALRAAMRNAKGMNGLPQDMQKALQNAMKQSGANNSGQFANMPSSGLGKLDKKTLAELAKALSKMANKKMGNCQNMSGMMSPEAQQALKNMMKGMGKLSSMTFKRMPGKGTKPGSGGVGRGRADAPLMLGQESDRSGARFKAAGVKPGKKFLPWVTLSKKKVSPKEISPGEFEGTERTGLAPLEGADVGEQGAMPLGPSRRKAAQNYFNQLGQEKGK